MIPAATAGIFLTVSKLWDAFNDPVIGSFEDRCNTRFGRYRPWLWTWIGIVIFFVLTFTKLEGVSQLTQNIFSFVMYCLLIIFYTTYEMAHVSLMSVMTTNYGCRSKLASYRMTFSNVSGVFLASIFMGLVAYFGTESQGTGYIVACVVLSVVAIPFFLWCFFGTKERVKPEPGPKTTMITAFKTVLHCKPALILAIAHMCWGITGGALSAARQYFYVYYIGDAAMFTVGLTTWLAGMAVGSWAANWLVGLFKSKRTIAVILWGITGVMLLLMNVIPVYEYSMLAFHVMWFLEGAMGCVGFTALFAMVPDVVEYEQERGGGRTSASIYSIINFAMKAGQAIVIGILNLVMGALGYVPNIVQNEAVLATLNAGMHAVPGVFFIIGAILFYFYKIDRSSHEASLAKLQG